MAIVTLSCELGCDGARIAAAVAERLGYRVLATEEVVDEAAKRYGVDRAQLQRALEPPRLFGPSRAARQRSLAQLGATLYALLGQDEVVHHGPLGAELLSGVSHAVRVEVTAPPAERAAWLAARLGHPVRWGLKAVRAAARRAQSWRSLVGGAPEDFDLQVRQRTAEGGQAVEQIVALAGERRFRATSYSRKQLGELGLAARLRAELMVVDPTVQVALEQRQARLRIVTLREPREAHLERLRRAALALEEVDQVQVQVVRDVVGSYIGSCR